MAKLLKLFITAEGTRPALTLVALLLAALFEAVGISAVLPAIAIVANDAGTARQTVVGPSVTAMLEAAGLAPRLETVLLLICVALVLKALISFAALNYASISAAKLSIRLRQRLVGALYAADWRFFASQEKGKFATAISSEASRAGDAYLLAAQYTAMAIQSAVYVLVAVMIDWRLALLGVGVGAVMIWSLRFLIVMTKRASYRQTDTTRDLTIRTMELFANIKSIKTMQRYAIFEAAIDLGMRRLKRALVRKETAKQILSQLGDVITAVALVVVIYVSYTVFKIPLSALVVNGLLFTRVVGNVTKLQKTQQQFVEAESAYRRVVQLTEMTEASREPSGGTQKPDAGADFRFERVSFAYGGNKVLDEVSLTIAARRITVLKGPSGSGKTTLIDLIAGLHQPQSGEVYLGGTPVRALDVAALRRRIGYVSQDLTLLHASIRDNVCLGDATISDAEVREALRLAEVDDFVDGLPAGLDTTVGETGAQISGGQRQRILLARALVTKPDILILDEVTSALDPLTESRIVNRIADLAGMFTVIAITHREAWARVADRLYDVRAGKVSEAPHHVIATGT